MTNNDVLRSLRYTLNVPDSKLTEIAGLAGLKVEADDMEAYLKRDDEPGFKECNDEIMAHILNGVVLFKRGRDETKPPQVLQTPITNNIVLKKLRVAFELKDNDLTNMIEKSGIKVTKSELSAFFRSRDHRNYRECGDQFLRNFLKGLAS